MTYISVTPSLIAPPRSLVQEMLPGDVVKTKFDGDFVSVRDILPSTLFDG